MPSKNTVKQYADEGYYHVYNRGVEKRNIFKDRSDYLVFIKFLRLLLEPIDSDRPIRLKNYNGKVKLVGYCLMPNHFHLLVQQQDRTAMPEFMKSLQTAYTMYFNKRHKRVGGLFQSRYKAALVDKDEYLLHLSRYIHLNPKKLGKRPDKYEYSSYAAFMGDEKPEWVIPDIVMSQFKKPAEYRKFMDSAVDSEQVLGTVKID